MNAQAELIELINHQKSRVKIIRDRELQLPPGTTLEGMGREIALLAKMLHLLGDLQRVQTPIIVENRNG